MKEPQSPSPPIEPTVDLPPGVAPDDPTLKATADQTIDLPPSIPQDGNAVTGDFISPTVSPSVAARLTHDADSDRTVDYGNAGTKGAKPDVRTVQQVGPYEILGVLGHGGMGVVYKGRHRQLGRLAAIKMILLGEHASRDHIDRFVLEAQSVAKLKNPGIVQLYDFGEHQGLPWFALEFVAGSNLQEEIAERPLEPNRAAKIVADLASSVAYAHREGVLHRDIKPANVLLAQGDQAKLTDFGLAKKVDEKEENSKTQFGQVMGTPSYMPPEQARGDVTAIGPASDQYSLSAMLYHLVTGRAPFAGARPMDTILQVISSEPVAPRQLLPSLPVDLETICLKALSKEPTRRYADCQAFEADLRRYLRGEPILARPIGAWERTIRWCRRNPKTAIPIAAAVASLLLATAISVWTAITLADKNKTIEAKRVEAVEAKNRADANEKLARQRAIDTQSAIYKIVDTARRIPAQEKGVRGPREEILNTVFVELQKLPDDPGDSELRTGLEKARVHESRSSVAIELGEYAGALNDVIEAEAILRERNTAQGTDSTRYNLTAMLSRKRLAKRMSKRDMDQVLSLGDESLKMLEEILSHPKPQAFDPDQGSMSRLEVLSQILQIRYQHALALYQLGRIKEALACMDPVESQFEQAMNEARAGSPNVSDADWEIVKKRNRNQLSDHDQLVSLLLAASGKMDDAIARQETNLQRARDFLRESGGETSVDGRKRMVWTLCFAGDLYTQAEQNEKALTAYDEASQFAFSLVKENQASEDRRNRFSVTALRKAHALKDSDPAAAKQLFEMAVQVGRAMMEADPTGISGNVALALALPYVGDHPAAAELAGKILKLPEKLDAEVQLDVARIYAGCAFATKESDAKQSSDYANRAMQLLADASRNGYANHPFVKHHPEFAPLKTHADWQETLNQIEANAAASRFDASGE